VLARRNGCCTRGIRSCVAMKTEIENLVNEIRADQVGTSRPWQGADVVITRRAPAPSSENFYPDPRFVETRFVGELSWLFEQLRDVFMASEGYGAWKEEFFGRLGNVAVKFQSVCPESSVIGLLETVAEEAMSMADEIEEFGGLKTLLVTSGNRILDDFTLVTDSNRYLSQARVRERLRLYVGEDAADSDVSGDSQ